MPLAGQVAIVTGGGSGIGKATCQALTGAGAAVAVVDIDGDRARAVSDRLDQGGFLGVAFEADVSKPDEVRNLVANTVERLGRVDILVNSAGINVVERFLDVSLASWQHVFAANVEGPLLMIQAVARVMADQDLQAATQCRGKIINVSSAAAEEGRPLFAAYGASKVALNHLSKTCALVLREAAIPTTVIYPGDVAEGMWSVLPDQIGALEGLPAEAVIKARLADSPLQRFQTAREVAEMILFVAAYPGLALNGTVLWTLPHASPL
jgi:NAD(P)-dependent dehydrogenase (short-subunit alcohol dehydrogenase family)